MLCSHLLPKQTTLPSTVERNSFPSAGDIQCGDILKTHWFGTIRLSPPWSSVFQSPAMNHVRTFDLCACPWLVGSRIFVEALLFDATANPAGLILSNAAEGMIGTL